MRRPPIQLRQGLDRDVYQVVRKLEDDDPQLRLATANVYEAIQRSNSSLKRQKKRLLEISIERVLDFRKEEARTNDDAGDSEAEIEAETDKVNSGKVGSINGRAKPPKVRQDICLF